MFKKFIYIIFFVGWLYILPFLSQAAAYYPYPPLEISPIQCGTQPCPVDMNNVYDQMNNNPDSPYKKLQRPQEKCADSFASFQQDPRYLHYWIEDPEITNQGKADERAREFITWVLNVGTIQNLGTRLSSIWQVSRNISYFFVIILASVIGLGFIIGQKVNFELKIKILPAFLKIAAALLYITFSAFIVLTLIQLSELLMKFFIEQLGGKDLFNIYFASAQSQEGSYITFEGCRDLNIRVQEGANAELFLLKLTNITYYVMGAMLILRQILLWFMLFVSPFLAILFPFVFIRNIGWIWIGVFFQWLCYGPLFALFLGALSTIWKSGIPYAFNFSRVGQIFGYVYPTAIVITYGGPAQRGVVNHIQALNNGNYVDTFAEYIITLIMLWAVVFFPWWLMRIFRDYCCDGIYAMKNILLSHYDQMFNPPTPPPPPPPGGPSPSRTQPNSNSELNLPKRIDVAPIKIKLDTLDSIRSVRTEEIPKSLNFYMPKLTDVARFETSSQEKQTVMKNLRYLSNPIKASTPSERQKYMNLRTELFNRAVKEDSIAKQLLSATSTSNIERTQQKIELLKTIDRSTIKEVPLNQKLSVETNIPQQQVNSINSSFITSISNNSNIVNSIAQSTHVPAQQVQTVLNAYKNNVTENKTLSEITQNIANQTGIQKEKITRILQSSSEVMHDTRDITREISRQESARETLTSIANDQKMVTTIAQNAHAPSAQIQNVLNSYVQNYSENKTINEMTETIAKQTGIQKEKVTKILQSTMQSVQNIDTVQETVNNMIKDKQRVTAVAQNTNTTIQQVKTIMQSYEQNIAENKTLEQVTNEISQQTGIQKDIVQKVMEKTIESAYNTKDFSKVILSQQTSKEKEVQRIIDSIPQMLEDKEPIIKLISIKTNIPETTVNAISSSLMNNLANNMTMVSNVSQNTQVSNQQVQTILKSYQKSISEDKPLSEVTQNIAQETGLQKEKVNEVLQNSVQEMKKTKETIKSIAQNDNVQEEQVEQVLQSQSKYVAEPEPSVEKTISIPSTISLEDYEDVKNMWQEQYETGEVPLSPDIKSREEWVDQDIVVISNILNKLLSSDDKLKQEGLDELGFILPIFTINNLKGDELMVYLKAKLEAAKTIKKNLHKDQKEEVKQEEEEDLVEVAAPKKEEEGKVMEMSEELDDNEKKDEVK